MKANDFMADWNKTHTSSPSFQDAIEWARKTTIEKACEWLESYCCEIGCKYDCNFDDIMVDGPKRFRKAMEE